MLYFFLVIFLLIWSLRSTEWEACSAGNIAKKSYGHFCLMKPLFFDRVMWTRFIFLKCSAGCVGVNQWFPATQNTCVNNTKSKNTLTKPLQWFIDILWTKMYLFFCIFPNTFIFTLIVFNFAVGYDISQCLVLFSNLHSHSTQNIIKINPKSKELCWFYYPCAQNS